MFGTENEGSCDLIKLFFSVIAGLRQSKENSTMNLGWEFSIRI